MSDEFLLIDLDNTLYDYHSNHERARSAVFAFLEDRGLPGAELRTQYDRARGMVHARLDGTASSHNRLLYFQGMLEGLGKDALRYSLDAYNLYWSTFVDGMRLFDGVAEFLNRFAPDRVCLVTDLTADVQHLKVAKLGLAEHIRHMVTSEEAGHEKPHPYIFQLALEKVGGRVDATTMIGDNHKKDVLGARALGMRARWFNPRGRTLDRPEPEAFADFRELL